MVITEGIITEEERDMNSKTGKYGMGWIPDYPDIRDYTEKTEQIQIVLGIPRV